MSSLLERFTRPRRVMLLSFVALAVPAVVAARRDLAHRSPDAVRGSYDLWRRLTWLPGPSVAYLLFARRAPADQ